MNEQTKIIAYNLYQYAEIDKKKCIAFTLNNILIRSNGWHCVL